MNATRHERCDVSVIVVNFYALDEMRGCLKALQESVFDGTMEILVVNNSAGDGSKEALAQEFPDVVYIEPGANLGFGPACNVGIKEARGDYYLLVNPDAYVPPEAIANAHDYFKKNENVGVVGVQLTAEDGGWHPSARHFPSAVDKLMVLLGLTSRWPKSKFFGRLDLTWWDHKSPRSVDWVVGAFFMIRGTSASKLGGFDERFFIYFEEMEFCRRIKKELGMEVHFVPCATVRHIGGASSSGDHMDESVVDGKQISHFRLFSEALYYGKYWGKLGPMIMLGLEWGFFKLRYLRNRMGKGEWREQKAAALNEHVMRIEMALAETKWGRIVPPQPWSIKLNDYKSWKGA